MKGGTEKKFYLSDPIKSSGKAAAAFHVFPSFFSEHWVQGSPLPPTAQVIRPHAGCGVAISSLADAPLLRVA